MQQQSRTDKLCSWCQEFERAQYGPASQNNICLHYGIQKDLKDRPECPLCRLILNMVPSDEPTVSKTAAAPTQGSVSVIGKLDEGLTVVYDGADRGLITWDPPVDAFTKTPSLISHLIKNWIKECENCHQDNLSQLAPRYKHPVEIVLVDVLSQKLVRASSSWRFLTISYVWGVAALETTTAANRKAREQEKALSKVNLPQIILDAMLLVSQIGERYLWVDCLCIEQDNSSQKHSQVSQMDVIYSQSLLTLVALSSKNAGSYLPGVREGTRSFFKAKDYVFKKDAYALYPHLPELSKESVYESRGWTFQERLLSRRCLFLTECDMYYTCHSQLSRETGASSTKKEEKLFNQKFQSIFAQIDILNMKGSGWVGTFRLYASLVHEYSKRELSYDTDAINAFSGISAVLGHFLNSSVVSGLIECVLDLCLLWVPGNGNTHCRNLNFPSWSWAGWKGEVFYLNGPLYSYFVRYREPEILLTSLVEKFETLSISPFRPIVRLLQHQKNSAVTSGESKKPRNGIDLLSFEAAAAGIVHLDLSLKESVANGEICGNLSGTHCNKLRVFIIMDVNQHACGYLHSFPGTLFPSPARAQNHRELVALSLSQYPNSYPNPITITPAIRKIPIVLNFNNFDILFDHTIFEPKPWCLLNIMLIEWKGSEAERITIGQMHIDAWNSLKTQRKRIRLV